MNNIDDMPPKCHDCSYWEICEEPYICPTQYGERRNLNRSLIMTVKELIELLQKENPDALVYTTDNTDDIALAVTRISKNILEGQTETVTIH